MPPKKYMIIALIILAAALIIGGIFLVEKKDSTYQKGVLSIKNVAYGEITAFHKNEVLQFPDFRVSYLGETDKKVDFNPNLNVVYYNFSITDSSGNEEMLVWSAGTGIVSPKDFVVRDRSYQLELKYSTKDNKKLTDNELIISLANDTIKPPRVLQADREFKKSETSSVTP
ncbi:MAG: hypothetical protein A2675_01340 [Candidatus Yonathbacteria bacterium RIFCSPHIGHO2_01_FULL_51_10]|uniref:Uncharacterized protein n=1 Tax=Candidatus Yonathbacteria bacterium RIFCSPHIGHO2_01_FULL_51_10 TaxID=1802723 RepID=A0A1G2S7Z2_9BACT|nr:MAG: hypothetical protein A2675_01340 [Candidatus Yonathbacteria bacterium RIFCSPHIGHO2_01_FULL_51_10]